MFNRYMVLSDNEDILRKVQESETQGNEFKLSLLRFVKIGEQAVYFIGDIKPSDLSKKEKNVPEVLHAKFIVESIKDSAAAQVEEKAAEIVPGTMVYGQCALGSLGLFSSKIFIPKDDKPPTIDIFDLSDES